MNGILRSVALLILGLIQVHSVTIIGENGHKYTLYPVGLSWQDASTICTTNDDGHLLILNDQEEVKIAIDLFSAAKPAAPSGLVHAGATDNGHGNGNFVDVMGERIINEFWDRDKPNDNGHCVATSEYGLYNDVECSKNYYFICENIVK